MKILGLLILIADIYAIVMIINSSAAAVQKIIWVLVILFLPVVGFLVWLFAGPGKKPF